MKVKELKEITKLIEAKKVIIGKERDELQEVLNELGDFVFDLNEGVEELEEAVRNINDAIDVISQQY